MNGTGRRTWTCIDTEHKYGNFRFHLAVLLLTDPPFFCLTFFLHLREMSNLLIAMELLFRNGLNRTDGCTALPDNCCNTDCHTEWMFVEISDWTVLNHTVVRNELPENG